jgi:hypothetical protein
MRGRKPLYVNPAVSDHLTRTPSVGPGGDDLLGKF